MEKYKDKTHIFLLTLIVIVTFLLRFYWLNNTILEGDMFRDLTIAKNITNGNLRYGGITAGISEFSRQQTFGPAMYYLIAPILALTDNPLYIVGFVALLNSLAVILTYHLCKKFFNKNIALISSALYAIGSWTAYMGMTFWNPNFLPFFSILLIYCLFELIIKKKDFMLIPIALISSIMLHFHLTTLFFIPIIGLALILFRRDIKLKHYIYSTIAFVLPFLPFFYFNIKNNISIFGPLTYGAARESSTFFTSLIESIGIPVMLATNHLGKYVYGTSFIFYNNYFYYFSLIITGLTVFIMAIGFIYLALSLIKKEKINVAHVLLLIVFFIPIFLQFIRFSNISPHYYFMIYPIQFIILGIGINKLMQYQYKKIVIIMLTIILLGNILTTIQLQGYITNKGTTYGGEFSIPYKDKIEIIRYLEKESNGKPINVTFFRGGKSFIYLLDIYLRNANYNRIESIGEVTKLKYTYLILDRKSYHSAKTTKEEDEFFDKLQNKKVIQKIEIYKLQS